MAKLRHPVWGEPLKLALYWYIESNMNAGGLEGSIILAQAAFESLSWTLLVEDEQMLSVDGYKKLNADDAIRVLLAKCDIPRAVPASLSALAATAKEYGWDTPAAITQIRNAPGFSVASSGMAAYSSGMFQCGCIVKESILLSIPNPVQPVMVGASSQCSTNELPFTKPQP